MGRRRERCHRTCQSAGNIASKELANLNRLHSVVMQKTSGGQVRENSHTPRRLKCNGSVTTISGQLLSTAIAARPWSSGIR